MKLKHVFFALASLILLVGCDKDDAITGISIDPANAVIEGEGNTLEVTAILAPEGAKANITWNSSNSAVATVVGNGKTAVITAVGQGTATITATADIFTGECKVVVKAEGSGNGDGGGDGDGDIAEGNGTAEAPYNITQVLDIYAGGAALPKDVWVNGYIVGGVKTGDASKIESNDDVVFGAEGIRPTAVLLADSKDVTDYNDCVIVNLPTGAIRNAVNLADNPGNLHKVVAVKGNLARYFAIPGVRDLTGHKMESDGDDDDPDMILKETFAEGQGAFSIVDVLLPEELDRIWYFNSQYAQMAAGSFANSRNYKSESWLVSPAVDLSSVTSATFSFEHAGKQFGAPTSNLTVQVSTNYSGGDVSKATWTELAIPDHLTYEDNTFRSAGDIDLTPYCGKANVRVAFKYTSTDESGGNWYVKNVTVK